MQTHVFFCELSEKRRRGTTLACNASLTAHRYQSLQAAFPDNRPLIRISRRRQCATRSTALMSVETG